MSARFFSRLDCLRRGHYWRRSEALGPFFPTVVCARCKKIKEGQR